MNSQYLSPTYGSPKQSYSPIARAASPIPISRSRSSSNPPHRVLGYFDIPTRSAPSSAPLTPRSRSSSPAPRSSKEFNAGSHGSQLDDALVGFSLVPNWLKIAMEQDQKIRSPDSITSSPLSSGSRTPNSNVTIAKQAQTPEEEDRRYWDEEDEKYWADMDNEDLEEA